MALRSSPVIKRSIKVKGRNTSVSLEDEFWTALKEIADKRRMALSELAAAIDGKRQHNNLSSAIRLFVLDFYQTPTSAKSIDHVDEKTTVLAGLRTNAPSETK
jgi:predicted DNA-binding ribbon-helix-helix protein